FNLDNGRHEPVDRIEKDIGDISAEIPDRERLQKWEDEVGTRRHAIETQRLTEVLVRRHEVDFLGQIEKTRIADGRIEQEAPRLDAGAFHLSLEDIVQEPLREPQIVENVAEADLNEIGDDE